MNEVRYLRTYLRERKCSSKINDKISTQVSHSNLRLIHNKLAPPKNTRAGGHVSRTELHGYMQGGEDVDAQSPSGDTSGESVIHVHANLAADSREEKVERIEEESKEMSGEEDVIPFVDEIASRYQNLVPPWLFTVVDEEGCFGDDFGFIGFVEIISLFHLPWQTWES